MEKWGPHGKERTGAEGGRGVVEEMKEIEKKGIGEKSGGKRDKMKFFIGKENRGKKKEVTRGGGEYKGGKQGGGGITLGKCTGKGNKREKL